MKCPKCTKDVQLLVPMGLLGKCFQVCPECRNEIGKVIGIESMSAGMKYYFENGVDKYPESNSDHW